MNFEDYYSLQTDSIDKRINSDRIAELAELAEENGKSFDFTSYTAIPIAASKEKLRKYAQSFSVDPINLDGENAIGLKFSHDNMIPEVWVKKEYEGYGSKFKDFIKEYYKITANFPKGYDIDHVLSRGQVKDPNTYIRLMMVDYKVNRSHGASTEKGLAQNFVKLLDPENLNAIAYLKVKGDRFTKGLWKKNRSDRIELLEELMPNKVVAEMILNYLVELSFDQFEPNDNLDYITQMEQFRKNK